MVLREQASRVSVGLGLIPGPTTEWAGDAEQTLNRFVPQLRLSHSGINGTHSQGCGDLGRQSCRTSVPDVRATDQLGRPAGTVRDAGSPGKPWPPSAAALAQGPKGPPVLLQFGKHVSQGLVCLVPRSQPLALIVIFASCNRWWWGGGRHLNDNPALG